MFLSNYLKEFSSSVILKSPSKKVVGVLCHESYLLEFINTDFIDYLNNINVTLVREVCSMFCSMVVFEYGLFRFKNM